MRLISATFLINNIIAKLFKERRNIGNHAIPRVTQLNSASFSHSQADFALVINRNRKKLVLNIRFLRNISQYPGGNSESRERDSISPTQHSSSQ